MTLSMLALLVPLALVVAFFRFQGGEAVQTVDTAAGFADARAAQAFPVAEPVGLSTGWRSLSAAFRIESGGAILRIGYLTPAGATAQLVESSQPQDLLVTEVLGGAGTGSSEVTVGGTPWRHLQVKPGEQAFVRLQTGRTMIVFGTAADAELGVLAASLR